MDQTVKRKNANWFEKLIATFFAVLASLNLFSFLAASFPQQVIIQFLANPYIQSGLALVISLLSSSYWHWREKRKNIPSAVILAWLNGILRYWLAFSISVYGFAKIFQTQFAPSIVRNDSLIGTMSGFQLTWNYFSYSYPLAVIIGMGQIIGSALLLFRKTTLLGLVVLMPILINIVLINIFYGVTFGAFANSVIYSLALLHLLILRWNDLVQFFLKSSSAAPKIGIYWLKNLVRFLCIFSAGALIYSYVPQEEESKALLGKWQVDWMVKNGDTVETNDWLTDEYAWTTVYVEGYKQLSFSPNPYLFDNDRASFLSYTFDKKKNLITGVSKINGQPSDTSKILISEQTENSMRWKMVYYGNTIDMKLSKAQKRN